MCWRTYCLVAAVVDQRRAANAGVLTLRSARTRGEKAARRCTQCVSDRGRGRGVDGRGGRGGGGGGGGGGYGGWGRVSSAEMPGYVPPHLRNKGGGGDGGYPETGGLDFT